MSDSPEIPPKARSDRYEAGLSDGLLQSFHADLLDEVKSYKEIQSYLPPWKSGPFVGKKPSIPTLKNIRDRLILEAQLHEDNLTAESVTESMKREVPGITDEQLDTVGVRTLSILSLRRQDIDRFLKLRTARSKGELEKTKEARLKRAEERADKKLQLEEQRFRRETCELFLTWWENQQAKDIASKPGLTQAQKIEQLGQAMYKETWDE